MWIFEIFWHWWSFISSLTTGINSQIEWRARKKKFNHIPGWWWWCILFNEESRFLFFCFCFSGQHDKICDMSMSIYINEYFQWSWGMWRTHTQRLDHQYKGIFFLFLTWLEFVFFCFCNNFEIIVLNLKFAFKTKQNFKFVFVFVSDCFIVAIFCIVIHFFFFGFDLIFMEFFIFISIVFWQKVQLFFLKNGILNFWCIIFFLFLISFLFRFFYYSSFTLENSVEIKMTSWNEIFHYVKMILFYLKHPLQICKIYNDDDDDDESYSPVNLWIFFISILHGLYNVIQW